MNDVRLACLASHNGSGFRTAIDTCAAQGIPVIPTMVISNNSTASVLEYARSRDIPHCHISSMTHPGEPERDAAICAALERNGTELVLLSGYMKMLGPLTLTRFANRIVNTHPALLPAFGGRGMYGSAVSEAVLGARLAESGVTLHLVDATYDGGPIVRQSTFSIDDGETLESLVAKVKAHEAAMLLAFLSDMARGAVDLDALAANAIDRAAH